MVLDRHIDGKLCKLEEQCQHAVVNTEQSGVRKPAYTVAGKLDQARIWLSNLNANDKGLGECLDKEEVGVRGVRLWNVERCQPSHITKLCL